MIWPITVHKSPLGTFYKDMNDKTEFYEKLTFFGIQQSFAQLFKVLKILKFVLVFMVQRTTKNKPNIVKPFNIL